MKRIGILVFVLIAVICLAFYYISADPYDVTLTWTAPYDLKQDGSGAQCAEYDLRRAPDTTTLLSDWNICARIDIPAPLDSGMTEITVVSNLQEEVDYFFAIKSRDSIGNWSDISNIMHIYREDATPPARISDLREQ